MNKYIRHASTRAAAVAALALVVAGLPAAANASTERPTGSDQLTRSSTARSATSAPATSVASTTGTIRGTVEIPPGATGGEIYVDAFTYDAATGEWRFSEGTHPWTEVDLDGDGTFELTGLEVGRDYRIRADVYVNGYLSAFYAGPDTAMVRAPEAGTTVHAPAEGLRIVPLKAARLSGSVTLPAGIFDVDSTVVGIFVRELAEDGTTLWSASMPINQGDTDYAIDVYPDGEYVIEVTDSSERFPAGFYHAGVAGLVEKVEHATHVPAGSRADLVVGTSLITPRLTAVAAPQVSGTAVVGEGLSATPGRWSVRGATFTYQWLRDGTAVPGATSTSYRLTPADAGSRIAVRVTATFPDLANGVATSTPTAPVANAPAPRATTAPVLTGTTRFAKKLRVTPGAWSLPDASVSYQWFRAGKPIKGATKRTYKLKKKDVRKRVSVRVTAQVAGHDDGVWTSSSAKVKKAKTTLKVKAKTVRASKRPKVVVRVKAGLAKPRGTVRVKYGKRTVKVKLKAKQRGKAVVRLPRLTKGKHRLVVRYKPAAKTKKFATKAKVKRVVLRVK